MAKPSPSPCPLRLVEALYSQEQDIFYTFCKQGLSKLTLADYFNISHTSVCRNFKSIKRKLGLETEYQMIIFFYTRYLPAMWKEQRQMTPAPRLAQPTARKKQKKVAHTQASGQLPLFLIGEALHHADAG